MADVPISQETLNQFKHDLQTQNNSADPGANPAASVEHLNNALGWLLKTADTQLQKVDKRLGTDGETLDRISELSSIVAQRHLSDDVLKNSPEIFLGTIVAGLAVEKWIVFQQVQKERANSESKESSSNE